MSKLGQMKCVCTTDGAVCAGVAAEPIDTVHAEDLAEAFAALGDPYRMAIIHLITATGEPVCVVDIDSHLPLAQSTVSYHLNALLEAGVIDREKRGRWSYYSLNPERLAYLTEAMGGFRDRAEATSQMASTGSETP